MKHVSVIQHTSAEWLGNIEDHLEGRGIRFSYFRPFATGGRLPDLKMIGDGLIVLGAGPWGGTPGAKQLPSFDDEVRLVRASLMTGVPVIGFGLGATIVAVAGDGGVAEAPLRAAVSEAISGRKDALGGFMPDRFPYAVYRRDETVLPEYADVLATDRDGTAAVFSLGPRAFGFEGHPGVRRAMFEDLVMEFEDAPDGIADVLSHLGATAPRIEDVLVGLMAGLVSACGWNETI